MNLNIFLVEAAKRRILSALHYLRLEMREPQSSLGESTAMPPRARAQTNTAPSISNEEANTAQLNPASPAPGITERAVS